MALVFWRICRWAAIGLILLAAHALAVWGIATFDHSLELGMLKDCEFLVVAFTCAHKPGGMILEIAFNLPLLVFVHAPMVLWGLIDDLLNTGTIALARSSAVVGLIAGAIVWLVLGVLGLLRGLATFALRLLG